MTIRNYVKQTSGLFARIVSKISALTVLQYVSHINGSPLKESNILNKTSNLTTIGFLHIKKLKDVVNRKKNIIFAT